MADVFDALAHRRPYKEAWPAGDAPAVIEGLGGSDFDCGSPRHSRNCCIKAACQKTRPTGVYPVVEASRFLS